MLTYIEILVATLAVLAIITLAMLATSSQPPYQVKPSFYTTVNGGNTTITFYSPCVGTATLYYTAGGEPRVTRVYAHTGWNTVVIPGLVDVKTIIETCTG